MYLLGVPASRRPVGSRQPELAGETPVIPEISSVSLKFERLDLPDGRFVTGGGAEATAVLTLGAVR